MAQPSFAASVPNAAADPAPPLLPEGSRPPTFGTGELNPRIQGPFASCVGFLFLFLAPLLLVVLLYHSLSELVLVAIGALFLAGLSPIYHAKGSLPAAGLTIGVLVSAVWGLRCYYAAVLPIRELHAGKAYANVFPGEPATDFEDAAFVEFAANATVDDSKALGFTSLDGGLDTYCVAPIQDSTSSEGRAEFWAVGVNCCGGRSDFSCDDEAAEIAAEGKSTAHGGLVVRRPKDILYDSLGKYIAPALSRHEIFLEAVAAAAAVHGKALAGQPVLVRWDKPRRVELITARWESLCLTVVLAGLAAGAVAAALAFGAQLPGVRFFVLTALTDSTSRAAEGAVQLKLARAAAPTQLEMQLLGFVLPLIALVACVVAFSWASCLASGQALLGTLVAFLLVAVAMLMMTKRTFSFGVVLLSAVAIGSLTGRWNFVHHAYHSCAPRTYRDYHEVPPDAVAADYSDAGKVWFAGGARLGDAQSVGVMHRGTRHCAVPVLPSSCGAATPAAAAAAAPANATNATAAAAAPAAAPAASAANAAPAAAAGATAATEAAASTFFFFFGAAGPAAAASSAAASSAAGSGGGSASAAAAVSACPGLAHADFWAVGVGCCDEAGGFACFPSGEGDAAAGLVFRKPPADRDEPFRVSFQGFDEAIRLSAERHELPVGEKPMLLHWGKDPEALRTRATDDAAKVVVLSAALAFFALALVANGGLALLVMRPVDVGKRRQGGAFDGASPASRTSGSDGSPGGAQPGSTGTPPRRRTSAGGAASAGGGGGSARSGGIAAAAEEPPSPRIPPPHSRRRRERL